MHVACVSDTFPQPHRYAYARRAFTLDAPGTGRLHLGAQQFAMVWVNGAFLGRTYVRHHDDELRYETWELTPHLRAGVNVVAVLLHAWGMPEEDIPGVPLPRPIVFAAAGEAGACDFADLAAWRVTLAEEYRPARRHNGLIGHEERRDLRREPLGWREPGFNDNNWVSPLVRELPDVAFLPSPLRPLHEEVVAPARIVRQGAFQAATALVSLPPMAQARYWRIRFTLNAPQTLTFYYGHRLESRLWVDGEERSFSLHPPLPWVELYQPVALNLEAGEHTITGMLPQPAEFQQQGLPFGWDACPHGGEVIAWAATPDGPFTPGTVQPDPDHRPMIDRIYPASRGTLGTNGTLELTVEDEDYAVIFEFPKSITQLPHIEIADATAGVELELIYSERLSDIDGLTIPAAYTDRVILREGAQTYEVSFQYKSARILILIVHACGGRATIRRVASIYRHYAYEPTGQFTSADEKLNDIWAICRNTMEFGSQDIIMDGPWREQLLYIGDNYVHNLACYHLFGNHEIVEWQHSLYAQGQMPDGIFQPNQPCRTSPAEYRLLDQTILWPIQLLHHVLYTDGQAFVQGLLPHVVRLMDGFWAQFGQPDDPRLRGVTGWNWVDHPGLVDGAVRSIRHDGIPTAINILYLLALQAAETLLRQAGDVNDAARMAGMAGQLRELLLAHHWDAGQQVFADCVVDGRPSPEVSVHVNLLAIEAGLADDANGLLDRTWRQPGVLQMCGPFFRAHLFEVLHRLGRQDEMLAEIREVWGGFIDAGLTSTPENCMVNGEWGASVGHPWGASPASYLVKSIVGLEPLAPGWDTVRFAPHLCDLPALQATVPTPHGPITADLRCEGTAVTGSLHVPADMTVVAIGAARVTIHKYTNQPVTA